MMSTTKDLGAQSNSEQEPGGKGESVSPNRPGLSVSIHLNPAQVDPTQVEPGKGDAGRADGVNGVRGSNGANGVHHSDASAGESLTHECTSAEKIPTVDKTDASSASNILATATSPDDEAVETVSPTAGLSTPRSAVKIKGRPGGVSLELGEGEWDELILLLEERLNAAEGFFRGGRVLLDVGTRALVEENLHQVRDLLEAHEMELALVRATAERTLQAAAEVGVSTTNEEAQESLHVPEPPLIVSDGPANAYTPSVYAPPPESIANRPNHFVHRGSLRSGQVLRKTESIVIIGDVNPGANVISGGDIMVWGRLRGIAHAGAEGNRRSVVAAIDFVPTQLRIANLTAIAPERKKKRRGGLFFWQKEPERRPEIARVIDGRIVVEPWDEGKPNSLGIWRK